jgi:hypothetical protein
MLDEFGCDEVQSRSELPTAAPELVSAEYQCSGDRRLAGSQAGSLVCYFRSPARALAPLDVEIEVDGQLVPVQAVSALEPGVWQANANLTAEAPRNASVRLRLGDGARSDLRTVTRQD